MQTKEFFFDLPQELIAQNPSEKRGEDRLLLMDRKSGEYKDLTINDFPSLLDENCVLVVNNSKVRKARTFATTENGGQVEFLFLEENEDHSWNCICNKNKKQKEGRAYCFNDKNGNLVKKGVLTKKNEDGSVQLSFDEPLEEEFFTLVGHVPLPPYIKREEVLIHRLKRMEAMKIPSDFDYSNATALSFESREKLKRVRPVTLAQASRISGLRASDIALLSVLLSRKTTK